MATIAIPILVSCICANVGRNILRISYLRDDHGSIREHSLFAPLLIADDGNRAEGQPVQRPITTRKDTDPPKVKCNHGGQPNRHASFARKKIFHEITFGGELPQFEQEVGRPILF
jgi:hypothetical protein